MGKIFWLLIAILPVNAFCQVTDDFSDGDFTNNPIWVVDNAANWTISAGQLRSNSLTPSSTFYITTPSSTATVAQWNFLINLQFNTSSANYVDVYLMSEQQNLTNPTNNGYFVRIGGTGDEIGLWKQVAGTPTVLIDGVNGTTNTSINLIRISVTRDASNLWTLNRDSGASGAYFTEGTATDTTFLNSAFFGIRITQSTASFHTKHYLDDFYVGNLITDTNPPTVADIKAPSENRLEVIFSENLDRTSAEKLANYSVNNGVGSAQQATLQEDEKTVILHFSEEFPNADTSELSIVHVADVLGNEMMEEKKSFFSFRAIPAIYNDIIISEIFADPSPSIGLPEAEFLEIHNRSAKAFDLEGWKIIDETTEKTLPSKIIFPGDYVVLANSSSTGLFESFNNVLAVPGFPTLTNTGELIVLQDNIGLLIDSVHYEDEWYKDEDKKTGGYSLERVSPERVCIAEEQNWMASQHASGGTPGEKNSVFNSQPDSIGPELVSIQVLSSSQVEVSFTESLKETELQPHQFSFTPFVEIQNLLYADSMLMEVLLDFSSDLKSSVLYTLIVNELQDCSGNVIKPNSQGRFVLPEKASAKDVIITEIFADPSPSIGLPEAEFLEIHNRSAKVLNLDGWKIADAATEMTLPSKVIFPGDYVVLVNSSSANVFDSISNLVAIPDFPTLANAGELIVLLDSNGLIVDSVRYHGDWYRDDDKSSGGYSLERISLEDVCVVEEKNWKASQHATGGTPGSRNSVFNLQPDSIGPEFVSLQVISPSQITLTFNEELKQMDLYPHQFLFTPSAEIEEIIFADSLFAEVVLNLSTDLHQSVLYTLSLTELQDCSGNVIKPNSQLTFILPEVASAHDVIITEIFADPSPSIGLPEAEFLEIHNRSEKAFDLKGWKIIDETTESTVPSKILFPGDYVVLVNSSSAGLFEGAYNVLLVPGLPTLTNTGELLVLRDNNGLFIDSVRYNDEWYRDNDKRTGGYSLERISSESVCVTEEQNWIASQHVSGGTPGSRNSVFNPQPDSTQPELISAQVLSTLQVKLNFSERMKEMEMQPHQFVVTPPIEIERAHFTDTQLMEIVLSFSTNLEPSILYTLKVNELHDCSGNLIEPNGVATFVLSERASTKDIIITEIFADPNPSIGLPEAEFMEIHNRSLKAFDLEEWEIMVDTTKWTLPSRIVLPGDYLVLANSSSSKLFESIKNVVLISGFPTLANAGELLVLLDSNGLIIDSVRYHSDWYRADDKSSGGYSLERISLGDVCIAEEQNWMASQHASGGTPGSRNSVFNLQPDSIGPEILSVHVLPPSQITLTFNEELKKTELYPHQFLLTPLAEIREVIFADSLFTKVVLNFSTNLLPSVSYVLTVGDLTDCSGNPIRPNNKTGFVLPEKVSATDVIITEILADPSPSRGLPETEFLEIYNRSTKIFDLKGWKIRDGSAETTLPSKIIFPGDYIVLVNSSSSNLFDSINNVVSIPGFPTLANAGELLVLLDSSGLLIDSAHYQDDWYRDDDKMAGGYSLERISTESVCITVEQNWTPSKHVAGGTPGIKNSVFNAHPDSLGPEVVSTQLLSPSQVKLTFNERLKETEPQPSQFLITPIVEIEKVYFADEQLTEIVLDFYSDLTPSVLYTLRVKEVQDCSGNAMQPNSEITFLLPEKAAAKDIIITEIFADPSPSIDLPEAEFIEIYNRSEKIIDLKDWSVSDEGTRGVFASQLLKPGNYTIVSSQTETGLFESYGTTARVSKFPSLNSTGDYIVLRNNAHEIIDSVAFDVSWYKNDEKELGGWTLELIDVTNTCGEGGNWIASEDESGGTPGRDNSVKGSKPDTTPPQLMRVSIIENNQLRLLFDEKLEKRVPASESFVLTPLLEIADVYFTTLSLTEVALKLTSSLTEQTLYTLRIGNLSDCAGNEIDSVEAIKVFALPQQAEPGDILINEILFNPRPFGADFIELYNASNKYIDLKTLLLANNEGDVFTNHHTLSDVATLLYPGTYLVLSEDVENIQTEYPQSSTYSFLQTNIPPLGDDEGSLVLLSDEQVILDSFFYSADMHSPLIKNEEGVSLERVSLTESILVRDNWKSGVASSNFATPGYLNANALQQSNGQEEVRVEPEVFEPVTGQPNFASIHYNFDRPGLVANAKIMDAQGRVIKKMVNNEVLASVGFFTWDGDQDDGTRARIGYYTLWMEVFDTSGFVKTFRKRIAIASRF